MANRQFLRRIKASAGRAILILAFMAVLSACGSGGGGNGVEFTHTQTIDPACTVRQLSPLPGQTCEENGFGDIVCFDNKPRCELSCPGEAPKIVGPPRQWCSIFGCAKSCASYL